MAITKGNDRIQTVDDWRRLAPPQKSNQWKAGRSAQTAAEVWLEGRGRSLPPEVQVLLSGHDGFGSVQDGDWDAEPEVPLPFDDARNPRMTDILVLAKDSHGPFVIAVEAKADETFGCTMTEELAGAIEAVLKTPASQKLRRVEMLAKALMRGQVNGAPPIGALRYQLLTACAGALCEAKRRGFTRAIMLVHEFVTDQTRDQKHASNAADLDLFMNRITEGKIRHVENGDLCGPISIPGAQLNAAGVVLYIGKVCRTTRSQP
jgi:hypothetical protein